MAKGDLHLPVLTSTSFQRWRFDIASALEAQDLYDIVYGTEVRPQLDGTDGAIKKWRMKDAKARNMLSMSLDEEHHTMIRSCSSAAEIWKTLVKYRESSTTTNKHLCNQS